VPIYLISYEKTEREKIPIKYIPMLAKNTHKGVAVKSELGEVRKRGSDN
jgi:hypothetical protein